MRSSVIEASDADIGVFIHKGAAATPGMDIVHLSWETGDAARIKKAWDRLMAQSGLADTLTLEDCGKRGYASCYPFVPLSLVRRLVAAARVRASLRAIRSKLGDYIYDASAYRNAYFQHRLEALKRKWPVWPLMLGQMHSLILGCGKHHRLVPMNLSPTTAGVLALGGWHKGIGRDLLAAYGLPVPPGGLCGSGEMAIERATTLGWPVVLKRLYGGNSDGVICGVADSKTCLSAAKELLKGQQTILVEKAIPGIELRAHFIDGEVREVLRRNVVSVHADGRLNLRDLLSNRHPEMLKLSRTSAWLRRRIVYKLWAFGVRRFSDLDRITPPRGQEVPTGLGFARSTSGDRGLSDIHPDDRCAINRFLKQHGCPSGGLDIIVASPGAPLADGGAILEINVPSGFWYLGDRQKCVAAELDAWTDRYPGFSRNHGRVPFWIACVESSNANPPAAVEQAFFQRYPNGQIVGLEDTDPWPKVLTKNADALLLAIGDDDAKKHGLPVNLSPTVWVRGGRTALATCFPVIAATLRNCGPGVRVCEV